MSGVALGCQSQKYIYDLRARYVGVGVLYIEKMIHGNEVRIIAYSRLDSDGNENLAFGRKFFIFIFIFLGVKAWRRSQTLLWLFPFWQSICIIDGGRGRSYNGMREDLHIAYEPRESALFSVP
jgi:hypothetical protein